MPFDLRPPIPSLPYFVFFKSSIKLISLFFSVTAKFIAMPSRKTATGEYKDIAHPINSDARKMFEDAIIDAYNKAE